MASSSVSHIRQQFYRRWRMPLLLVAIIPLLGGMTSTRAWAESKETAPPAAEAEKPRPRGNPVVMWQAAEEASQAGDGAKAVELFQRFYESFRDTDRRGQAEEALWRAAQAAKSLAEESKEPDWEGVRDLFRMFSTDFSDSPRAAEAYFEVGYAHYRMRYLREALIYFKLFGDRFPNSPLRAKSRLWLADLLFGAGRLDEAANAYQEVIATGSEAEKARATVGLADVDRKKRMRQAEALAGKGDHAAANAIFNALFKEAPDYYLRDPELLRRLGAASLREGREEEGRRFLYHYLNLIGSHPERDKVLLDIAESHFREGEAATAVKLFRRILDDGGDQSSREAAMARFRLAEYQDEQARAGGRRPSGETEREGDKPFEEVLASIHSGPVAQGARRSLFRRRIARGEFDQAVELGMDYLRDDKPGLLPGEKEDFSSAILLAMAEELLRRKEHEKLHQLYVDQYRHVEAMDNGRFLFLVGQALEARYLYDQASEVYFRAQGLPLSPEDKAALYFRRAEVYLLRKDWAAADRLLRYLRDIYKDAPEAAEVYSLSARLAEARGDRSLALEFYNRATATPAAVSPKKGEYGEGRLRMLVAAGSLNEAVAALDQCRQEKSLSPEVLQGWYRKLGDALLGKDPRQARAAYLAGVGEGMPQAGETSQRLHFQLGELMRQDGEIDKARDHLGKAMAGPDNLLKMRATEGLNQLDIDHGKK